MIRLTKLALLVLGAGLAACGDAVGPRAESADSPASENVVGGISSQSLNGWDTLRFEITIDPAKRSTFYLGAGNNLTFPKASVCDPETAHYGDGQWDKPCKALHAPITVSVKGWLDKTGHPQVDFSPNIRFVPSDLPSHQVFITFSDYGAVFDPLYQILYCPNLNATCKDESTKDASLLTFRDPLTGQLKRRIKHFSGYLVGAGDVSITVSLDGSLSMAPLAIPTNRVAFIASKTGYILVSG